MTTGKKKLWRSPGLSEQDKRELGTLMADHRAVEEIADYPDSPTSRAIFRKVEELMMREAEYAIESLIREVELSASPARRARKPV